MRRQRTRLLVPIIVALTVALTATSCTIDVPDQFVTKTDGGESGDRPLGEPDVDDTYDWSDDGTGDGSSGGGSTGGADGNPGEGDSGENAGGSDGNQVSVLDPEVASTLASFGPWRARDLPPFEDGRSLKPYDFVTPQRVKVSCSLSERAIPATEFTEFAAFPFSGDKLPGLIVEGNGIESGDLRVVPLPRAPLPLVVNLASETPSVVVDSPDPSSLQGAVSELMRTADARLSGLPVVPANIRFYQREASSYEEAVLNMGVSLRYKGGGFKGKFQSDFEQSTTSERHTVTARLLQPMFTISVDKSRISDAGDYIDPGVSMSTVNGLRDGNRIGADNPPVLIDAVTYGRVVYMTVTSDKVTSADELKVAVSGAYGGFSGDADVAKKNQRIVEESEIKVEAFGGDDDVALQALKEGTIQAFMQSVNTATAAPLSMVLRNLDGSKLTVTDEAKVTDIGCRREALANEIEVQVTTGGGAWGTIYVNGSEFTTVEGDQSRRLTLTGQLRANGNDEIKIWFRPGACIGGSMTVSFIVNGQVYQNRQWRIVGTWDEWACAETGTWTINKGDGTVSLIDGPPALRPV